MPTLDMATNMLYTAILTLLLSLVVWKLSQISTKAKINIPNVDFEDSNKSMLRYERESIELVKRGYEQHTKKGTPFTMFNYLDSSSPAVILPFKYLAELRNASASKLSFPSFLNKVRGDVSRGLRRDKEIELTIRVCSPMLLRILVLPW